MTDSAAARSGILAGASFLGGVVAAARLADAPYPRPGADPGSIRRYFRGNPSAARLSVAGQLLSAVALGRFTASVATFARRSQSDSRFLPAAAVAGGATAVVSLAMSAGLGAALTAEPGDREDAARSLHRAAFLTGGVAHGVGFGLLVGALGLAGRRTGQLPRSLTTAALASGAAGLLTPLYLIAEPAAWFIPAGRFSGLLVSGIAGAELARPGTTNARQRR